MLIHCWRVIHRCLHKDCTILSSVVKFTHNKISVDSTVTMAKVSVVCMYVPSSFRNVIMSQIREKSQVGSLWPTVLYIRINNVYVVLATFRPVSRISHYSPVTSLKLRLFKFHGLLARGSHWVILCLEKMALHTMPPPVCCISREATQSVCNAQKVVL